MEPPKECANCGAEIPRGAKACPECGADERTGWRETSVYDGLELPDADETGADEGRGGAGRQNLVNGIAWYWWFVGLTILLLIVAGRFWL